MIYTLLLAHFVGDFLLQNDWMALNKSKRWDALGLHVGIWTAVIVMAGALVQTRYGAPEWRPWPLMYFMAVNGVGHLVQDRVTSRMTARLWFFRMAPGIWAQADYAHPKHGRTLVNPWEYAGGSRHWFFVTLGADQMAHLALLLWTAERWL